MTNKFGFKFFPATILLIATLLFAPGNLSAQISYPFQLNYGGTELKGSVDIFYKIEDKTRDSPNKTLQFSEKRINADVSKFKKPTLVVEISNLKFKAPKKLIAKLGLDVSAFVPKKGFAQNMLMADGPLKIKERKVYNFEIAVADTVLVGDLKIRLNSIQIENRSFKLNNTLQIPLNIIPPPLFPPDATEKELWKIVSQMRTVKAMDVYIERYPQGQSIQKAKRQKKYLIDNPPIKYIPDNITGSLTDIPQKDENTEWRKAVKAKKIDGFDTYLNDFPDGKYAKEAANTIRSLSDSLDNNILKSAREELLGRLVYQIADTMTMGHTYRVRLEISSDTTAHFIEKLISTVEEYSNNPQDLSTEIIEIGNTMHAHLEDSAPENDKNFYIHLFGGNTEREVDLYSSKPTIWEWDVRPLKAGFHPLYFTIEIITKKDGIEKEEVLPVYDSKITILSQSIFQRYKTEFISGGIISALLLIILTLFLKKKKSSKTEKDLVQLVKSNPTEGAIALIENDNVNEALEVLDQIIANKDPEIGQEIILLKSRLSNIQNNLNKAIISKESASNERNSIKLAALDIIERSKSIS